MTIPKIGDTMEAVGSGNKVFMSWTIKNEDGRVVAQKMLDEPKSYWRIKDDT